MSKPKPRKNKKHSPRPPRARAPRPPQDAALPEEDEVVHVPRGSTRTRFFIILGLMFFVLIVFVVPGQFMSALGGGSGGEGTYISWRPPGEGVENYSDAHYAQFRRDVADFWAVQSARVSGYEEDDFLELILFSGLARATGLHVSDRELGGAILEGFQNQTVPFGSKETYDFALQRAGVSANQFEDVLRRYMLTLRFHNMLRLATGLAEPGEVERLWNEQHRQYAFDYVVLKSADLESDPDAQVPGDEELQAWFEAQTADELQRRFRADFTPERLDAELVGFLVGGATPTALLERFPAAPDTDAEQEALDYYNTSRHIRFRRPEPAEGEAPPAGESPYLPFEEVAETARSEAPIRTALATWLGELQQRAIAGEEIDLAAEAADLGLQHLPGGTGRTREEWIELEGWGGPFVANALAVAPPSGVVERVTIESGALLVGRVVERIESAPPAFADARDRIAEVWVGMKTSELALTRLQDLEIVLRTRPAELPADQPWSPGGDRDAFIQKVADAGFQMQRLGWFDRRQPDLFANLEGDRMFLLTNPAFFELGEGELASSQVSFAGDAAYLVRSDGVRDPEQADISPAELASLRTLASIETAEAFFDATIRSRPFWREHYEFSIRQDGAEEGSETDPESEPATP